MHSCFIVCFIFLLQCLRTYSVISAHLRTFLSVMIQLDDHVEWLHFRPSPKLKSKKRLLPKFSCRTRIGMSSANDTAWQKKGFDSLTCELFWLFSLLVSIIIHEINYVGKLSLVIWHFVVIPSYRYLDQAF